MSELFTWVCAAELAVGALVLVRLVRGPTVSDRLVALNAFCAQATLAIVCFGLASARSIYLDVAMWSASFSYLTTIVWARYLERGFL